MDRTTSKYKCWNICPLGRLEYKTTVLAMGTSYRNHHRKRRHGTIRMFLLSTVWISKRHSIRFRFIGSYLTERKFRVAINDKNSSVHHVVAGVPQGSILGPLLYIMFIHDIPKFAYTKLGMFADDTSITVTSRYPTAAIARAQAHLNALYDYFFR